MRGSTPFAFVLVVLVVALATTSCDNPPPPVPITEVTFPIGFLWGAATAGFQVEGGLDDTDWGAWAMMPNKIAGGANPDKGPDAFAHVDEDIANLAAMHLNSYRFSIEMARLYPTRAEFDADMPSKQGLADYAKVFAALKKNGITPLVTLHHFAWPLYMSDPSMPTEPQGWERSDAVDVFSTYCGRMAERYGGEVDYWVTINEPMVEATVGYIAGIWPPGVLDDPERMLLVMQNQVQGHARCYDQIHLHDTMDADGDHRNALVSVAQHDRVYEPADETSTDDEDAAEHSRHFWNQWFMDAIIKGDIDQNFDDIIGDGDTMGDPTLAGRADYYGLNYYGVSQVSALSLPVKYMGFVPTQTDLNDGRPKTDLGWSIYPGGFGIVLDEASDYDLPIIVTENGIADATDSNRSRFLLEHAYQMGLSVGQGLDVIGYFHWALMDNFEWASGYCPRFGLYHVDYTDPNRARTATKAIAVYQALATTSDLQQSTIDALPKFTSQPITCNSF